mgnify:CR=1 FL=1
MPREGGCVSELVARSPCDGLVPLEMGDETALLAELRRRVDTVPIRLALAQAAKESGWGTSRFARKGNNFFGQWCYDEGCGLVPRARGEGRSHEVRAFDSPGDSVASYLRNINTHHGYRELRHARAGLRAAALPRDPPQAAAGPWRRSRAREPDHPVRALPSLVARALSHRRSAGHFPSMISSSTSAARGSSNWPSQKTAVCRISGSSSMDLITFATIGPVGFLLVKEQE